MTDVARNRMPSYTTDTLKFESYSTTPRSLALESSLGKQLSHDSGGETDSSFTEPAGKQLSSRSARSAPSHFSTRVSQSLTERLLDNSEQCSLDDILVFESAIWDDWSEAASGWGCVVPYPKYIAPPNAGTRPHCSVKKSVGRSGVHCVDDAAYDLCPSWKGNVEPLTYRYVPNNGYYRTHKSSRDNRESTILRRTRSEKLSRVTPEMRHAQKTLKRDLEYRFRSNGEDSARTAETTQDSAGLVQSDTEQYVPETPVYKRPHQQLIKSASDLFMEKFNTKLNALEKELQTPTMGSKKPSGESSAVPHHSLTQLTRKLREVRASDTGRLIPQHSKHGATDTGKLFSQHAKQHSVPDSMKPTIQNPRQHGSDFGEDLFTVIPIMCKPDVPLRPLEKLTPKQRQMEKTSVTDRVISPDRVEEEDLMIILSCATSTSHPPPLPPKDHDSSGITTARSAIAMTNFDIEKMRNVPLHSDMRNGPLHSDMDKVRGGPLHSDLGGGSKPRLTQKEGAGRAGMMEGGGRGGTMRYTVGGSILQPAAEPPAPGELIDRKELFPRVDKMADSKLGTMGNALPEIMGKRLSVITATHRLL